LSHFLPARKVPSWVIFCLQEKSYLESFSACKESPILSHFLPAREVPSWVIFCLQGKFHLETFSACKESPILSHFLPARKVPSWVIFCLQGKSHLESFSACKESPILSHILVYRNFSTKKTKKMQLRRIIYCSSTALHASSDIFAHHQDLLNCIYSFWYYSRVPLPAAVMTTDATVV
jgi:ribosomal protein L39E